MKYMIRHNFFIWSNYSNAHIYDIFKEKISGIKKKRKDIFALRISFTKMQLMWLKQQMEDGLRENKGRL